MVPCGTVLAAQLPRPLQAADQRVVVTGVSLSLPAGAFRHFYVQATFMRFGRGFSALNGRSNGLSHAAV